VLEQLVEDHCVERFIRERQLLHLDIAFDDGQSQRLNGRRIPFGRDVAARHPVAAALECRSKNQRDRAEFHDALALRNLPIDDVEIMADAALVVDQIILVPARELRILGRKVTGTCVDRPERGRRRCEMLAE
jgi:hypothetical protein